VNRSVTLLAVLLALPAGSGMGSQLLEAEATIAIEPEHYEEVFEVLDQRAIDLSDHEKRTVARAICEEAEAADYDPFLVLGMIDVESDFRRDVVSSADARGLMQIQPATLGWLMLREGWSIPQDVVADDPALQVRLGVRYVRYLHDRFGSLDAALMAYNMGPGKYGVVSAQEHGLDPYWSYARAVRRDTKALKAGSMAIGSSGGKPLATADGLWGG
jgi:soluble lytic murein transglycosylase